MQNARQRIQLPAVRALAHPTFSNSLSLALQIWQPRILRSWTWWPSGNDKTIASEMPSAQHRLTARSCRCRSHVPVLAILRVRCYASSTPAKTAETNRWILMLRRCISSSHRRFLNRVDSFTICGILAQRLLTGAMSVNTRSYASRRLRESGLLKKSIYPLAPSVLKPSSLGALSSSSNSPAWLHMALLS
jgi:hypothetical protein